MLYSAMCRLLDHSSSAIPCEWKSPTVRYREHGQRVYQLEDDWWCDSGIAGCAAVMRVGERVIGTLDQAGGIRIYAGFVWDGPSGPTYDTRDSMGGSLAHDFLYRLARRRQVGSDLRDECDGLALRIWLQDGMRMWRARLWFRALRQYAGWAYSDFEDPITVVP